ncbi:unnamed protein product, partial [Mesorhabditis belari]|uniref:Long-chain-fatty-acid--CoA ligase n=1 Tax=Mesorhabditis belari TaxID=2138241 RepID=A0AAF3E8N5_9BILA
MWDQFGPLSGTIYAVIGASLFVFFSVWRRRKAIEPPMGASIQRQSLPLRLNFERQSIELEGQPGVFKCGYLTDDHVETVETAYPEVHTLYDVFLRGIDKSENGDCLGRRHGDGPYKWIPYSDVFRQSRDIGAALITKLGLKPGNETNVGIYARNSPEWFVTALGCIQHSIVVVPLYDTLGAEAASYIIQQADIEVIIVDNLDKVKKLLESGESIPSLKHVVVIDPIKQEDLPKQDDVTVYTFQEVLGFGQLNSQPMHLPTKKDTYIICYTSGTTGTPKGVVLSHQNVVANLAAFELMVGNFLEQKIGKGDTIISYLPLSHMFEQVCHWAMMQTGARIGYFRGNINQLNDDLQALHPTIFPVVPRLLNRFYDAIQANLRKTGAVGKAFFNFAYSRKLAMLKNGISTRDSIWDKMIFKKIQDQIGGSVRLMATGSAPISAEVLETCRVALGAIIFEGYGQTECTALATNTWPGEFEGGHTGGPAPCTLIKLEDVPELNYFAAERKGEVLIKGPHVTTGYYKEPEKTAEIIDADGFLHTGDIGYLRPNGTLKIIDRKKHIFKLAQGEYVAPEKIENVYTRVGCVQQVFVDGDSLERYLIAVVVPETKPLLEWDGRKRNIQEICKDPKAAEFVLKELVKIGKENKLNSIEQVKHVVLEADPFSVENGLLTPTLKAKRPQLRIKYMPQMKEIYKNNPL